MKFNLEITEKKFADPAKIAKLQALGFSFRPLTVLEKRGCLHSQPDRVSSIDELKEVFIELSTLEELMAFCTAWGGQLVVTNCEPLNPAIEIYNGDRE
jgi:hypothetical protein